MVEGRIVAICQHGGEFVAGADGSLTYNGGEAHAIDIAHDTPFDDFKAEITSLFSIEMTNMVVKYFLRNNRRTLITVSTDKDLHRMVEFNLSASTTEVFVLSKQERAPRSAVADSGTSITAAAAAGNAKRKRETRSRIQDNVFGTPNGSSRGGPPTFNLDSVRQRRQALMGNVGSGILATAPDASTPNQSQQRLATAGFLDHRENGSNLFDSPSTPPPVGSLVTPEETRLLGSNTPWDSVITGVGQEFDNVKDFRAQLCKYSISKGFVYKFIKNEASRVSAKCVEDTCPWRLTASESARKQKFLIKKLVDTHTCGGGNGRDGQKRGTRHWLTSILKEKLHNSPECKPKEIVKEIFDDYGVSLTYSQVWRVKGIAQKELYHTLKETYSQLPWFCERILETNPGSVAMLSTSLDSRFRRFFVSFHASLHGFEHGCRPLLFLDRIPLKSNNQCKLLAAVAVDGDDAVFPVAFAVVEDETYDSWLWFLGQLKYAVTASRTITFVSNRQKGLDEAVPHVFEDSYHSYCLSHLIEEFKGELRKGPWALQVKEDMLDDFTRAAQACVMEDFNASVESIRSVSHEIADWVMASKPQNWSDALFRGSRYDHYSSRIVDSLSSWIPVKSESSVVQMVDAIRGKLMDVMDARREAANAWTSTLTPSMEEKLEKEVAKAKKLIVMCSSESVYEVRGNTIYVVNIESWLCTCCRWQVSGLPCMHAVAVFNRVERSVYEYCSRYFRADCYRLTYSATVHPIPDLDNLDFSTGPDSYPPPTRRTPSRPRRKRFNPHRTGLVVRLCSKCKIAGHNKSTCESGL